MYNIDVEQGRPNWRIVRWEVVAAIAVGGVGAYFHSIPAVIIAALYAVYMVGFALASMWSDTLFGKASIGRQHVQFARAFVILLLLVSIVLNIVRHK
jgi:uncharacterized membrane protein YfcA